MAAENTLARGLPSFISRGNRGFACIKLRFSHLGRAPAPFPPFPEKPSDILSLIYTRSPASA